MPATKTKPAPSATDFDANAAIDPATLMAGDPIGDAAEDDLQSPAQVRQLVKSLVDQKTVDPLTKFEKPADPRLGNNARERLTKACGTAGELRELQAAAEFEQRKANEEADRLAAERDAEIASITRDYADRIAQAHQAGRGALGQVATMRSARDQVLGSAPDWLKKQRQARERAIVTAHHEGTTCLQSEVERKRNFVHPPSNRSRSYACASSAYASYVMESFSEGHPFVPVGGKRDQNLTLRHLEHLHAQWSAELPDLEKRLADNEAAKARDFAAAEDEAVSVAIESL